MPWQEESTMELRRQFMQDVQSGATPITELCVAYGISRKTGYKWLTRYEAGGLTALGDQSRQPRTSPTATPSEGRVLRPASPRPLSRAHLADRGRARPPLPAALLKSVTYVLGLFCHLCP